MKMIELPDGETSVAFISEEAVIRHRDERLLVFAQCAFRGVDTSSGGNSSDVAL
jgi:hypothetical protein